MKKILALVSAMMMTSAPAGFAAGNTVIIKGSDTQVNVVQRLAEVFMEQYPGKKVSVTGGGSGTGVAALINGKCDIANSSRSMKDKEISQAMDRGISPKRILIGMDGLSVIVNESNPVDELTSAQIAKIYKGEITNWSQVGGPNQEITLYGRQPNSGTYVFFRDYIKGDYSSRMKEMNGTAQIVEAVKQDPGGIGYVGVGYLKEATGVNIVNVAPREGAEYSSPLDYEKVKTGEYPISRPLNQYVNGDISGDARDFILFELSSEGQKIMEEEGFYRIPEDYKTINAKNGFSM